MRAINVKITPKSKLSKTGTSKPEDKIAKPLISSNIIRNRKFNNIITKSKKFSFTNKFKLSKKRTFFLCFSILILVFLGYGFYRMQVISSRVENTNQSGEKVQCTNILNPDCWTAAFKPQLKQTNGFTNALIIGIDSRASGASAGLMNTDTLIVASFDHTTQKTMMISIPRDFWIPEYSAKVNAIYAYTYKKNPDDPYKVLKEVITKITGKEIHYLVRVNLEGVIKGVDAIGGIEVCPKEAFIAKYPVDYPKPGEPGWNYFDFPAGCQQLDGNKSLVYARFRYLKSGPGYMASDFDRGRRQQEVLEAIKNKMLSEDLSVSDRAEKYYELMQTFKDTVQVDISFEDILAGLSFINSADRDPINIVLDPNFGGLNKFIITASDAVYKIKAKDASYQSIQAELTNIWKWSEFYQETPKIMIRNLSGADLSAENLAQKLKNEAKYPAGIYLEKGNASEKFSGIKVFDLSQGAKPKSLKYILTYLNVAALDEFPPEEYAQARSSKNEDILILIGPDAISIPIVTTN
ncbi:MAG: LCP family protein [bacterium]